MRLLLAAGADPNIQDGNGDGALIAAAGWDPSDFWNRNAPEGAIDFPGVVRALLEGGSDPNTPNNDGVTPFLRVVEAEHGDLVQAMVDAGANPSTPDHNGVTPLMRASEKRNVELAQFLLDAGADPNLQNVDGKTVLMMALSSHSAPQNQRKLFLDAVTGADAANLQNKDGETALMLASVRGYADAVGTLLTVGADPDIRNNLGRTALMLAADNERQDVVRALLKAKADPDIQSGEGQTALMYAAAEGDYERDHETLMALLNAGADANLQDTEGNTALNYASRYDRKMRVALQEAMSRPAKVPTAETPEPAPAASPAASPVVEIDGGPAASLANETYLGGMKTRGMKVYALSGDGNWCAEKVVFKITAPSGTVFTDGTAEFYMKRFGERINEAQFCPAARSADIHGYTDTGTEPVFTGKATAAAGWSVN